MARHVNSQHTLLTDAWTADVQDLERGIAAFAAKAGHTKEGFIHNQRFESTPTATILRSIRDMVLAPRS